MGIKKEGHAVENTERKVVGHEKQTKVSLKPNKQGLKQLSVNIMSRIPPIFNVISEKTLLKRSFVIEILDSKHSNWINNLHKNVECQNKAYKPKQHHLRVNTTNTIWVCWVVSESGSIMSSLKSMGLRIMKLRAVSIMEGRNK